MAQEYWLLTADVAAARLFRIRHAASPVKLTLDQAELTLEQGVGLKQGAASQAIGLDAPSVRSGGQAERWGDEHRWARATAQAVQKHLGISPDQHLVVVASFTMKHWLDAELARARVDAAIDAGLATPELPETRWWLQEGSARLAPQLLARTLLEEGLLPEFSAGHYFPDSAVAPVASGVSSAASSRQERLTHEQFPVARTRLSLAG